MALDEYLAALFAADPAAYAPNYSAGIAGTRDKYTPNYSAGIANTRSRYVPPTITPQLTLAPGLQGTASGNVAQLGVPDPGMVPPGELPNQLSLDPRQRAIGELSGEDPALRKGGFWRGLGRGLQAWALGGVPGLLTMGSRDKALHEAKVNARTQEYQRDRAFTLTEEEAKRKAAADARNAEIDALKIAEAKRKEQRGEYETLSPGQVMVRIGPDGKPVRVAEGQPQRPLQERNPQFATFQETDPTTGKMMSVRKRYDPETDSWVETAGGRGEFVGSGTEGTVTENVHSGDINAYNARITELNGMIEAQQAEIDQKYGDVAAMTPKERAKWAKANPADARALTAWQNRIKSLERQLKTTPEPKVVQTRRVKAGKGGGSAKQLGPKSVNYDPNVIAREVEAARKRGVPEEQIQAYINAAKGNQ
jgi:hypothetical protein